MLLTRFDSAYISIDLICIVIMYLYYVGVTKFAQEVDTGLFKNHLGSRIKK